MILFRVEARFDEGVAKATSKITDDESGQKHTARTVARKAHAAFVEKLECSAGCILRFLLCHRSLCVPFSPVGRDGF
jgi:hypothetical protein